MNLIIDEKLSNRNGLGKYGNLGDLISHKIIRITNHTDDLFKQVVMVEREGWNADFASYKTASYVFRSDHWIFNCYEQFGIIDTFQNARWISLKKEIPQLLEKLKLTESSSKN